MNLEVDDEIPGGASRVAHSGDADHRFREADRRFRAMPITLEERRSIVALGVGLRVEVRTWGRTSSSRRAFSSIRP